MDRLAEYFLKERAKIAILQCKINQSSENAFSSLNNLCKIVYNTSKSLPEESKYYFIGCVIDNIPQNDINYVMSKLVMMEEIDFAHLDKIAENAIRPYLNNLDLIKSN